MSYHSGQTAAAPVNCKEYEWKKKLATSAIAAVVFLFIAAPSTYRLTDKIFGNKSALVGFGGRPTLLGLLTHTVVFGLIVYLLMEPWKKMVVCK